MEERDRPDPSRAHIVQRPPYDPNPGDQDDPPPGRALRHQRQQLAQQIADLHAPLLAAVAVAEGHGIQQFGAFSIHSLQHSQPPLERSLDFLHRRDIAHRQSSNQLHIGHGADGLGVKDTW